MNIAVSDDTIVAVATSAGEAGIGIVRISGPEAFSAAQKLFRGGRDADVASFASHTIHHGWIIDPADRKTRIDEVLLTVMRAPRTYTREDTVEINCHGGLVSVRAVLDAALGCGCRLAEPGEFTKRAFLNGRIDLAQAEAVLDLIRARTDAARVLSLAQLEGGLSKRLHAVREALLEQAALIEAYIDFPEDDVHGLDLDNVRLHVQAASGQLERILRFSRQGKIMREGVSAVICGRANVGKSSLLNALLREERCIVTSVAGTTRDTIEETIDIRGIPVRIADTAGIITPRDLVERKAVQRSRKRIAQADLVILVLDASRPLEAQDTFLIKQIGSRPAVAVLNKSDLRSRIDDALIRRRFSWTVSISAKKTRNIEGLEEAIADLVCRGMRQPGDSVLVSNRRHIEKIRKAQTMLAESLSSMDNKEPAEIVAQSLKDSLLFLDDILGLRYTDAVLDKIFSQFCIGK